MRYNVKKGYIASLVLFALMNISSSYAEDKAVELKTDEQKVAYATGASFGYSVFNALQSKKLALDPEYIIHGFSESVKGKPQLSQTEMDTIMQEFSVKLKKQAADELKVEADKNITEGNAFRENFAKQEGVKKTASGLLYKIEKAGFDKHPTAQDTVEVHYRGSLIDGREFDSSYVRNETTKFPLSGVIKGWTEGLQLIGEGGKMMLVIPPELAYGDSNMPGSKDRVGISPQSTLVFNIELIKITEASTK